MFFFFCHTHVTKKAPVEARVSEEELARVDALCMNKARRRLQGETGVRIERVRTLIEIKNFVVLQTAPNAEEPFYIAQV